MAIYFLMTDGMVLMMVFIQGLELLNLYLKLKNQSQVHGVIGVALCKPADEDKEGTCEDLGYPGYPLPF